MSDSPFWRPGARPAQASVHPVEIRGEEPVDVTVEMSEGEPSHTHQPPMSPSVPPTRSSLRRRGAGLLTAGLLVGVAGGALLVPDPPPLPLEITVDNFPAEVLGRQRDDLPWRRGGSTPAVERLDDEFRDQVSAYRFAYGGDGAEFSYGEKYWLTVVNGRLPTVLPTLESDEREGSLWVPVLQTDTTSCIAEVLTESAPPFDLSEVLDDDSKDVFYYIDDARRDALTQCVFYDEQRNLGLALRGFGPAEETAEAAERFRAELDRLHADLTG